MQKLLAVLGLLLLSTTARADVYQKVLSKSVLLHVAFTDHGKHKMAGCSGTYVGPTEVLTAAHCFEGDEIKAWVKDYNGVTRSAHLLKLDHDKDLALVQVEDWREIIGYKLPAHAYAVLGKEGALGQRIINVGCPFGLPFLLSEGIISRQAFKAEPFTGLYTITTAMINPGSSGGGVFDTYGNLIGVNTLSIGGMFGWAGISAAVDLRTIKEFLN